MVDWSTDLVGLSAASIEFTLNDPKDGELNLGSGGPVSASDPHALLLGLKSGRRYTFRIIASAGSTDCVSADQSFETPVAADLPVITRDAGTLAASRADGFILACSYSGGSAAYPFTDWKPRQCGGGDSSSCATRRSALARAG